MNSANHNNNQYDSNAYVVDNKNQNEFDSIPVKDVDNSTQNTQNSNSGKPDLECCCTQYRWEVFLHGICIIAGLWSFIAGFVGFGSKFTQFQDIIIYCYLIFFGVLIVFLEFKQPAFIYSLIGFYDSFHGRTLFFVLVGGLPLGRGKTMAIAGGFILVVAGFLFLFWLVSFCPACLASWDLPSTIPIPILGLPKSQTNEVETDVVQPKKVLKNKSNVPETKIRGPGNLPPPPPEPCSWNNPNTQQTHEPVPVVQQGSAYYNTSTLNNDLSDDEQLGVWGNKTDVKSSSPVIEKASTDNQSPELAVPDKISDEDQTVPEKENPFNK